MHSRRLRAATATLAACAALLISGAAFAQPATDIWLLPVTWPGDTAMAVGAPENVTHRPGYDNQPAFLPDNSGFLYSAIDGTGQADVFIYVLKPKKSVRLTITPESEYSPTPIPGDSAFSCVRVEADSVQRLWRFPLPEGEPTAILPDEKRVGYHLWAASNTLALFLLGEPNHLDLVQTESGHSWRIADNPGRSIHRIPTRNAISFVSMADPDTSWIMRVDMNARVPYKIIPTRPGREDMIWIGPNEILMSDGNRLMSWTARDKDVWTEVAAFDDPGLQNITRMALSPDRNWLAIVSGEPEKK